PMPDGFTLRFYKANWSLLKGEIMEFMNEFHSNGKLLKWVNSIYRIGVNGSTLNWQASLLNCQMGCLAMTYPGIPIGINPG
ncbi:hypothetical protein U1Q18_002511, partial [Sarracenia purpurea var. burkii]